MPGRFASVRLDVGWQGIDVDSAPSATARAKGPVVQNYLTGNNGRLRQRGGILGNGLSVGQGTGRPSGILLGGDRILLGHADHKDSGGARYIEPHVAPYVKSADSALAKAITAKMKVIDLISNTLDTDLVPTAREYVPGIPRAQYGKFAYGISYDSPDDTVRSAGSGSILVNNHAGKVRGTRVLRWDTTGSSNPVVYTYTPWGSQDLRIHYGRFLFLGGRDPDPSVADLPVTDDTHVDHNLIYFTQALTASDYAVGFAPSRAYTGGPPVTTPTDGAATAFVDADLGTRNVLYLPGDDNDFGVGFGQAGRHLAVFKRREVVLLTGFGPDSYQMRTFGSGIGCLDPRSIVEAQDGSFFLSQHGYMFFDGVQFTDVSRGLHNTLLAAGLAAVGDGAAPGGFASGVLLDNDYILLTIGTAPFWSGSNATAVTTQFIGLFHIPTATWSTVRFPGLGQGTAWPMVAERSSNKVFAISDSHLNYLNNVTVPENQSAAVRGTEGQTGFEHNIVNKWHSKPVELAAPFAKANLHRIIIDHECVKYGLGTEETDANASGPLVSIRDGAGTDLVTAYRLPFGKDDSREVLRRRHVKDIFAETDEVQVVIEWPGTGTENGDVNATTVPMSSHSILDVWIEYQPGAERH